MGSEPSAAAGAGPTVAQLGEEALVEAFASLLPQSPRQLVGNGDDCAVLAAPDGRYCVSTDVLVEGHHFKREWSTATHLGRRVAAQNLADAAAMGALPVALVVALVLPPSTPVSWVQGLARGLAQGCRDAGAGVVGGDLSAGESVVVCATVHGDLQGRDPVLRSGARPGDLLVHVGHLGRAAAGLACLRAGLGGQGPGAGAQRLADQCVELFLAPCPPLWAGPALAGAGATSMIDVSDSLLRDAGRLARASGVVIDVDDPLEGWRRRGSHGLGEEIELLRQVACLLPGAGQDHALELARSWALTGGEDHGLLATVPAATASRLPQGARVLGRVRAPFGSGAQPGVLVGGQAPQTSLGWDHFKQD